MEDYTRYLIPDKSTILDALKHLNTVSDKGMLTLFAVNESGCVVGSLTDGDCRRAVIRGVALSDSIQKVIHRDFTYITDTNYSSSLIRYIREKGFKLVPYLNDDGSIKKIIDFSGGKSYLPIDAVLMAGGKGERLRPMTITIPKPLLKVGDKAIIDYNIDNLIHYGIDTINVTVNYLAEQIEKHFSVEKNGVKVKCCREGKKFLGTIGGIQCVKEWNSDTILLMNSDLFTNIDFEAFYQHFLDNGADISVAAVPYTVNIPYGIFELDGVRDIVGVKEKPSYYYYANAGIYLFKRTLLDLIPENQFYNATDFLSDLIVKQYKVIRFPISGYWIDIGKPADFQKAQELAGHFTEKKMCFL